MTTKNLENHEWKPKSNITAHELALIIPLISYSDLQWIDYYNKLPPKCKRHFIFHS